MSRSVRLDIESLAPTGEGVARLSGKTIFVEGALPEERVAAELFEEKSRFARARTLGVDTASADRRATDEHSARCGGTDWAHFDVDAARRAKRDLFLETMKRIGGIPAESFGSLPISESPLEYRLRNQFHIRGGEVGFFERHSHTIVPLDGCEIVSAPTREKLAALAGATRSDTDRVETVESVETVGTGSDHEIALWNRTRAAAIESMGSRPSVEIRWNAGAFSVSARSFFQVNRFRFPHLSLEVEQLAQRAGGGSALDAYSGVGFFSHSLAKAGYDVTAVESSSSSLADAQRNRLRSCRPEAIRIVGSGIGEFLTGSSESYDLVIADPPRAGLAGRAAELARRARTSFLYVSCDPASLARDLRIVLSLGFEIESALLEDFFPLTHRVEALVSLRRAS